MIRFVLGFVAATAVWAALFGAMYAKGLVSFATEQPVAEEVAVAATDEADPADPKKKRKGPRRLRSTPGDRPERSDRPLPQGNATTGDDLGWDGDRQLDMNAGEEQLSGKEIEAGFDSAMSRIRRCLVLVPAEGEVTGKLTFGMRVGSDGQPKAVNLSGPAVVTKGESGDCLRQAAQGIRFAKFNGPDMLFKYPITLQ